MGGDYVAVACDGCKIVSSYSDIEFRSAGMTDTPDPFRNGQRVHCACGLTAVSPKAASLRQHELESSDNNLA